MRVRVQVRVQVRVLVVPAANLLTPTTNSKHPPCSLLAYDPSQSLVVVCHRAAPAAGAVKWYQEASERSALTSSEYSSIYVLLIALY